MSGSAGHLVVIDMQRVFADPDSPWAAPDFAAILPTVAGLVKTYGDAVTIIRFVAPERPTGAWRDYYAEWPFALQPPDAPLWDIVPELGSRGPTLDTTTFSKWGPALADRVGDDAVDAGVAVRRRREARGRSGGTGRRD
jgi:nicotinamidase-related amidase